MSSAVQPPTVEVNGVELAYVEQGRGDPVVLVHGSLGDYRSWGAQLGPFAEHHRVIAYSRRYHWPNAQPGEGASYAAEQHAADLGALIESLGPAPAHVVGASYGAMTALTLAARRPDLIRSLVLGEPPLLPWLTRTAEGPALFDAFIANAFRPAGQAFARGDDESGVRLFIDGVMGGSVFDRLPAPARQSMLSNAASMRAETVSSPEEYFPSLTPDDVSRVQAPVLLVQGEASPHMFGLVAEELARALPNAERALIPAASHSMNAQNPPAYNAAVLTFLAEH